MSANGAIFRELATAKLIRVDPDRELFLAWYGGHTLRAYNIAGVEWAMWTIGDCAQDAASPEEVMEDMDEKIATGEYP